MNIIDEKENDNKNIELEDDEDEDKDGDKIVDGIVGKGNIVNLFEVE